MIIGMMRIASALAFLAMASTHSYAWTKSVETDPIDDSKSVALMQDAEGTYTTRYGENSRANLQIVCQRNSTGLALVLPNLYTSDNGGLGTVTFRVDAEPAYSRDFIASNDHGSMAVIGAPAITAIKKMLRGKKLLVQFITVNETSKIANFDLGGLSDQIGEVRETCGWLTTTSD